MDYTRKVHNSSHILQCAYAFIFFLLFFFVPLKITLQIHWFKNKKKKSGSLSFFSDDYLLLFFFFSFHEESSESTAFDGYLAVS